MDELCEKVKFVAKYGTSEMEELLVDMIQRMYSETKAKNPKAGVSKDGNRCSKKNGGIIDHFSHGQSFLANALNVSVT